MKGDISIGLFECKYQRDKDDKDEDVDVDVEAVVERDSFRHQPQNVFKRLSGRRLPAAKKAGVEFAVKASNFQKHIFGFFVLPTRKNICLLVEQQTSFNRRNKLLAA